MLYSQELIEGGGEFMTWSKSDQEFLVKMIGSLGRHDQWKFPVEVRQGLRDMTVEEGKLYLELRNKWDSKKRADQVALLKRLPLEIQEEFHLDARTGRRPLNFEEHCKLRGLIDGGILDPDE